MECRRRTDEKFDGFKYKKHQFAISPLTHITSKLVSRFPLDYMHVVCLGVVKHMLYYLLKGKKHIKIGKQQANLMSNHLLSLHVTFRASLFADQGL